MDADWVWILAYILVLIVAICFLCYQNKRSNSREARREAYKDKLARSIVREIVTDFTDRRGLRQEWENIDYQVRAEIIITWRNIVRDKIRGL